MDDLRQRCVCVSVCGASIFRFHYLFRAKEEHMKMTQEKKLTMPCI